MTPDADGHNGGAKRQPEYRARICDIPEGERPRERFRAIGPSGMSQRELLAIILRSGAEGTSALQLADMLLQRFGGLHGLALAGLDELQQVHGIGPVKAIEIKAALELGRRLTLTVPDARPIVRQPAEAAQLLMLSMGLLEQEEVHTLLLDTRNRVIGKPMVYRGSLNSVGMRIGEIFRDAIRSNAAALIVAHNHPSGDPAPSAEDVVVTRALVQAGKLLSIELLDHIIIVHNGFVSLKERGLGFE